MSLEVDAGREPATSPAKETTMSTFTLPGRFMPVLLGSLGAVAVACGGSEPRPLIPQPMSAQRHDEEALRHEREARGHEQLYDPGRGAEGGPRLQCFDRPLAGVAYSGTEPLVVQRPCWTAITNPTAHHKQAAAQHRELAAEHRAAARRLRETEAEACAGLGEDETSHTPFYHREDILRVEPYYESGRLRGARVTFRIVPGLTASWMRHALHCHAARAAVMGYDPTFMSYCPLSLQDVSTAVTQTEDGLRVTLRSDRSDIAHVILGRARDLITADRAAP
jgi:hypothetical protein